MAQNPESEHSPEQKLRQLTLKYQQLATPNTCLTVGRLNQEIPHNAGRALTTSERFQADVNVIDWPSDLEDGPGQLEPRRECETIEEFQAAIAGGELANFFTYGEVAPHKIGEPVDFAGIDTFAYGTAPPLIRLGLVGGDLQHGIKAEFDKRTKLEKMDMAGYLDDKPELIASLHTMYKLMGRLVKAHDPSIQMGILGDSRMALPYSSVDEALRR